MSVPPPSMNARNISVTLLPCSPHRWCSKDFFLPLKPRPGTNSWQLSYIALRDLKSGWFTDWATANAQNWSTKERPNKLKLVADDSGKSSNKWKACQDEEDSGDVAQRKLVPGLLNLYLLALGRVVPPLVHQVLLKPISDRNVSKFINTTISTGFRKPE